MGLFSGTTRLALRGLVHHRRGHLLVAGATAVAAAVLVGALVVGDSVRGSLRAAFTERLGEADFGVLPRHGFRDDGPDGLAARLLERLEAEAPGVFAAPAPVLRLSGTAFGPDGAPGAVTVFGVDERYFALHGLGAPLAPAAVRVSPGLAEAGVEPGDSLLIRVEGVAGIASASFFGDKGNAAVSFRRTVEAWPDPAPGPASGAFSLFPVQGRVRAVFVRLDELRGLLDAGGPPRANALLVRRAERAAGDPGGAGAVLAAALEAVSSLDDRGLDLRSGTADELVLESRSLALDDPVVEGAIRAAGQQGLEAAPVLTWLATSIAANGRETPYSLIAGLPPGWFPEEDAPAGGGPDLLLPGPWLAEDLGLAAGDPVEVSFLVWDEAGRFHAGAAPFRAGAGVALEGVFADAALAPEFPGVTDSARIGDWDPPFPVDLDRIRDRDEAYWEDYRTLPKAFVPYAAARRLWEMRQGGATSVRFAGRETGRPDAEGLAAALLAELPAVDFGLVPVAVRADGLEASKGATDFGIYFLYFSWFLLVSAFVLIALLFRLGIERRLGEIGVLLAGGWPPKRVSRMLLFESGIVAFAGVVVGCGAGLLYADGIVRMLSGVWEGAVAGTFTDQEAAAPLRRFTSWGSVGMGALGAFEMAALAAWWTTRRLVRMPPRQLLAGSLDSGEVSPSAPAAASPGRRAGRLGALFLGIGVLLAGAGAASALPDTGAFFGAGSALLAAALAFAWARLRGGVGRIAGIRGFAFRAAGFRPGRSLAAMALVAFAAFTLVAVESFRKRSDADALPAGAGGVLALTETVLGVPWDPESANGREALNLDADLGGFRVRPLRLAGHEDASCLNLYRPARPRVVGVPRTVREENRFPFAAHLGESEAERENPWLLLDRERAASDPIPVVGDQNSMTYVLKWPVGEERSYPIGDGGAPVRLRLVATLWDSLFQGELLMAEEDLLASLPVEDGSRLFLVDRPGDPLPDPEALASAESAAAGLLTDALSDYGAVSTASRVRLDAFHRVENTYLSTFQALGGLGLLLGTLGLGAVLLRNADERRKEWALLAAAGYRRRDFAALGFWENAFLLTAGVGAGALAALVSVLPLLGQRGAGGSFGLLAALLLGILVFGLLTGALAASAAATRPILPALRAE